MKTVWLSVGAVLMLANTDTFGAATFAVVVALGLAWLGAKAEHDSGAQAPMTRKKVRG